MKNSTSKNRNNRGGNRNRAQSNNGKGGCNIIMILSWSLIGMFYSTSTKNIY